jgi:hypothetical protein
MVAKRIRASGRPPYRCDDLQQHPAKGKSTMTPTESATANRRKTKKGQLEGKGTRSASRRTRTTGIRAAVPITFGEDARAYRGRLKEWTGSLEPRNPVERYLVERAVALSWQLDRAERAQFERLPALETDLHAAEAHEEPATTGPVPFDDSERGERLRRFQFACSRALSRTLQTFARIRELGEEAELEISIDSTPAAVVEIPSPALDRETRCRGELGIDDDIASLTMLLAAVETAGSVPTADPSRHPAGDPASGIYPLNHEDPSESTGRPSRASRRHIPDFRGRQAEWAPSRRALASADDRRSPDSRTRPRPDAPSAPLEGRRRVGGYEVPLDCSTPVACADRIPVRLRREAAARR